MVPGMAETKDLSQPLVSVIIPNYNYGHYISSSIESVLNQSYRNIELIFVDDGSTDDSVDIAKKYGSSIILIQQQNAGVSAARNHGLALAKGDFICFLDSDDSWEPEKIELQIRKFREDAVGVVYSSINICDERLVFTRFWAAAYNGDVAHFYFKFPTRAIVLLGCSSAMIRRDVAIEVGNFDTSLNTSADWDYFRRIANVTRVDFVDKPLVNYRRHSTSMSVGSLEKYYQDNELAVLKLLSDATGRNGNPRLQWRSRLAWIKFQFGATKALLRGRRFSESIQHLKKLFALQPLALRKASQNA